MRTPFALPSPAMSGNASPKANASCRRRQTGPRGGAIALIVLANGRQSRWRVKRKDAAENKQTSVDAPNIVTEEHRCPITVTSSFAWAMTGRRRCRIQLPRTDRRLPMHLTACPWPVPTCQKDRDHQKAPGQAITAFVCRRPTADARSRLTNRRWRWPRFIVHRTRAGPRGAGVSGSNLPASQPAWRRSSGLANAPGSTVAMQHSCQCRAYLRRLSDECRPSGGWLHGAWTR